MDLKTLNTYAVILEVDSFSKTPSNFCGIYKNKNVALVQIFKWMKEDDHEIQNIEEDEYTKNLTHVYTNSAWNYDIYVDEVITK